MEQQPGWHVEQDSHQFLNPTRSRWEQKTSSSCQAIRSRNDWDSTLAKERLTCSSEHAQEASEVEASSTQTKTASRSGWSWEEMTFPLIRPNPTISWINSDTTRRCSGSSKTGKPSNMTHT